MEKIDGYFEKCFSESTSSSAPVICAITGTGGMGKTQTALEYAYARRESHHLTAVFWVSAATEETIRTSLVNIMQKIVEDQARVSWPESHPDYGAIAHSLGISGFLNKNGRISFDPESINAIQIALFKWLKLPGNSKWLMIFDNADDLTFGIDKYFPTHGSGAVLVTSRRPEFSHCAGQLDLDGLDRESSINLLLHLTELRDITEDERKHATVVVQKLGYMPLAISHAGCFIRTMNISVDEYLKYYEKAFKEAQSQVPRLGWGYRNDTAVTTWEVSFLAIQKQDKEAASLLLTCSYLNPNEIFERLWEDDQSDVKAILEKKKKFSLLASYSLISRGQRGAFSIHPVVHEWARERVEDSERYEYIRGALYILKKPIRQKQLGQSKGGWDAGEERRIMAHAMVLCGYLDPGFIKSELNSKQEDTLVTINGIAFVLYSQSKYDEAIKQYQKVFDWQKRVLGENHPETLATIRVLASCFDRQGRYNEALQQYQKVIASRKALSGKQFGYDVVGENDTESYNVLHSMATSLYNLGRYTEAYQSFQEAYAGKERLLGKYHSSTLHTLNNMAAILSESGRPREAMERYQEILAFQENSSPRDEQAIQITTNNIAASLNRQGRYEEAIEYHTKALKGMEKILDPDHASIFSTIRDIASVLCNQGKYTEALEQYQKALGGLERALGPEHPQTLQTAGQIATVFKVQGLYDEAIKRYRMTLAAQERQLGMQHPLTLQTIHNIGSVLRKQDKHHEALVQFQIALDGREKVLGEGHPDTISTIYESGIVLHSQKRYPEALLLFHRALAGFEAFGQDYPERVGSADAMERIALVYVSQEKFREALKWCSKALASREKTLGKDHPLTITAANTLSNCKKTALYQHGCVIA
ncbi:hypothetical protein TWF730_005483 [Orbilia blumenaviensis]|uniref:NB-ARC domain-containing protein n=1 Tax=Orbilia blumenaviensis TaxID=1796055 RepID=A0AAV9VKT2_9PEZI